MKTNPRPSVHGPVYLPDTAEIENIRKVAHAVGPTGYELSEATSEQLCWMAQEFWTQQDELLDLQEQVDTKEARYDEGHGDGFEQGWAEAMATVETVQELEKHK